MLSEFPFLRMILEYPNDDNPRLVFADWLEEHSQYDRASFIRVQCELARPKDGCRCIGCYPLSQSADRKLCRTKLRRRELELLETHGERWVAALLAATGVKPTGRQWVSAGGLCEPVGVGGRRTLGVEFCRGLVGSVTLTCRQFFGGSCGRCEGRGEVDTAPGFGDGWISCPACRGTGRVEGVAAALFRAAPITSVTLSDKHPHRLPRSGDYQWYFGVGDGGISDTEENVLPVALHLGQKQSRFNFEHKAIKALSEWCVSLGRQLADLPELDGIDKIERAGGC